MRFVLPLFLFLFTAPFVQAASLYIDPAFPELYRGDAVKLAVRLDTDEESRECVNAVDSVITYTDNISPVDISVGDSIFSIWVEEPKINPEDKTITFAGGLPNGYCGRVEGDPRLTNTLLEIIVRSPGFTVGARDDSKIALVDFVSSQTTAYLNDGLGTEAELTTYGAQIALFDEAGSVLQNPWNDEIVADTIAPEEFSISLERDGKTFGGKYYIVFNTTDKQTGIDHYEVIEESADGFSPFSWGRADAPWITARSPYVLQDQSLNSTIRVKAVDKAGNEYVATLIPSDDIRSLSSDQLLTYLLSGFVGILAIVVLVTAGLYMRRKRFKRIENESKYEE